MRAFFPWGVGLFALLVLGSISDGYLLVSPVYRRPYLQAPDTCTAGYYYLNEWGQPVAVFYALRPPFPPVGNMLPGAVGHGIQTGYLPHTILMSKEGMDLGPVPLLKDRDKKNKKGAQPPQPPPGMGGPGPGPYPTLGTPQMQMYGNVQQPYAGVPLSPYPMGSVYGAPGQDMMPYALPIPGPTYPPGGPNPYGPPMGPNPYGPPLSYPPPQSPSQIGYHWPYGTEEFAHAPPDTGTNIHQVQNMTMAPRPMYGMMPTVNAMTPMYGMYRPPSHMNAMMPMYGMPRPQPNMMPMYRLPPTMAPRPGYYPMTPRMYAMAPIYPMRPGVPGAYPLRPYYAMGSMAPLYPMTPITRMGPMAPMAPMLPMQMPNLDALPPPQQQESRAGGSAYPVHPFTHSPRDFFMWSENLEDERARGTRQFPAP